MERKNKQEIHSHKKNQLSISISRDGLSYLVHNDSEIIKHKKRTYFPYKTPEELLDALETFISDITKEEINRISVLYNNPLFTAVPKVFFDTNHLSDYLKFTIQMLPSDFAVYDEVGALDLSMVYIPFANINNFLLDRFGEFNYSHHMSAFLKFCHKQNTPGFYIDLHSGSFQCCGFDKERRLILANSFEYQTPEDFIYYVLFCYEEVQLSPESTPLFLMGTAAQDEAIYEVYHKFIRHHKVLNFTLPQPEDPINRKNEIDVHDFDPVFLDTCLCE